MVNPSRVLKLTYTLKMLEEITIIYAIPLRLIIIQRKIVIKNLITLLKIINFKFKTETIFVIFLEYKSNISRMALSMPWL